MRKLLSFAALAAIVIATPASAQWDDRRLFQPLSERDDIEERLDRLYERIESARWSGGISEQEAEEHHREGQAIADLHQDYRRDGLSDAELSELSERAGALRDRLPRDRLGGGWEGDWREDRGWGEEGREDDAYGRGDAYRRYDDFYGPDGSPRGEPPALDERWEDRFDEDGWQRDRWDDEPRDEAGDPMTDDSEEPWFYGDAPPPD